MTKTSQSVRYEYVDKGDTIQYVVSTTPVTPRPVVLEARGLEPRYGFPRPATIVAIALVESYEKYGSPDRPRAHQQTYMFVTMTNLGSDVIIEIPEIEYTFPVAVCEPEVEDTE